MHKLNHPEYEEINDRILTINKEKKFFYYTLTIGVLALLSSLIIMSTPLPMVYGLQVFLIPLLVGGLLTFLGGLALLKYSIEASKIRKLVE